MLSVSELQARRGVLEPAVNVEGLDVTYRVAVDKHQTAADALRRFGRRQRSVTEVHALKGLTFSVSPGSVLGVVGANGAGKSTLMRAIAGILPPTKGRITVNGRVSTLLALGIGFNSALSGRENILLGGLAAGLTRAQVAKKYDEIAEFTGIAPILDRPMKTYSSGQYGRVAFSVAVHMEPDILIVDEALSAGDAKFKVRAEAKMRQLVVEDTHRTVILVTHGLQTVRALCNEAIWLDKGVLMKHGQPGHIIKAYMDNEAIKETEVTANEDI